MQPQEVLRVGISPKLLWAEARRPFRVMASARSESEPQRGQAGGCWRRCLGPRSVVGRGASLKGHCQAGPPRASWSERRGPKVRHCGESQAEAEGLSRQFPAPVWPCDIREEGVKGKVTYTCPAPPPAFLGCYFWNGCPRFTPRQKKTVTLEPAGAGWMRFSVKGPLRVAELNLMSRSIMSFP